jgi:membrane-bound lytic murein transglycosylase D
LYIFSPTLPVHPFLAGDAAIRPARTLFSALFAALVLLIAAPPARSDDAAPDVAAARIPFPAELQRDVDFWIRVYTEISTSEGFLHDEHDLGVVYRTVRFRPDVQPRERRDAVDAERAKIEAMLTRLAAGATDLSEDEQQIARAFGSGGTPARYAEAAKAVRFQLGQADRFRAGLERSSTWETHIAQTFANLGLPPELAVLPHVESSFDPTAYSKVGAAGLWQFMPGTGRLYLRVNDAVDERMDPFRATEAAAQLLDYNYRFLGSWPLALTAYNHGAAGMRRASESLGTTDIATIVRTYKSKSFGFASRNFYVSFLAALTVDRNPEKYFGNLVRRPEMAFTEVEVPAYMPLAAVVKTLKLDRAKLVQLNPAFRPALLSGSRLVPKGYKLRLPPELKDWSTARLAQQVSLSDQYLNQPRARSHRVRKGQSLVSIAERYSLSVATLAKLNGLSTSAELRAGRTLRLPELPATRVSQLHAAAEAGEPGAAAAIVSPPPAGSAPPVVSSAVSPDPEAEVVEEKVSERVAEQRAETEAVARSEQAPEAVSAAEAAEQGPSLVPGGAVARAAESIDFTIGADDTIRIAPEETIGHYADWLGLGASSLRKLNRMSAKAPVVLGRKLKLDFSKSSHEEFDTKRRAFHETLQAAFFANHRITGTQVYVTRRGDSLWMVAQRNGQLPTWLVLHYNPDIDFNGLRAGMEIVIPKVEEQAAT